MFRLVHAPTENNAENITDARVRLSTGPCEEHTWKSYAEHKIHVTVVRQRIASGRGSESRCNTMTIFSRSVR